MEVLAVCSGHRNGAAAGKRRVAPAVAVDDGDRAALRALRERGVEVVVRRTPLVPEGSLDWL